MNKYEIVGIVGEGAYGIVYKAKNKENGEFGKYCLHSNTIALPPNNGQSIFQSKISTELMNIY